MKRREFPNILTAVGILVGSCLIVSPLAARGTASYGSVPELMAQAKAHAIQLREDAAAMESFDRMPVLCQFESIQAHVRDAETVAAKLEAAIKEAYPWQKAAMGRTISALRELAETTAETAEYVAANAKFAGTMEFAQTVGAHYDWATKLAATVDGLVEYSAFMDRHRLP
jgi:hypothetical protein